jgi:hypothetical protein
MIYELFFLKKTGGIGLRGYGLGLRVSVYWVIGFIKLRSSNLRSTARIL